MGHNELQKKYKTVSTSASELVEDVIDLKPKKMVKINLEKEEKQYPKNSENNDMFANKGYEEYFDSDGENGALIHNPQYEEIFKKLEKSVDNEIRNIPTYSKSMFENPYENFQVDLLQKSFDNVPSTNLTPKFFDDKKHFDQDPAARGKSQRNYQRVVASASEVIEHVIDEDDESSKPNKRRVKIRKGPKRRKKFRN